MVAIGKLLECKVTEEKNSNANPIDGEREKQETVKSRKEKSKKTYRRKESRGFTVV